MPNEELGAEFSTPLYSGRQAGVLATFFMNAESKVTQPVSAPTCSEVLPKRRSMLPDGGKICEMTEPPWQNAGDGHHILCHIPLETLRTLDPVVQVSEHS